jgi:hypothetical protein
MQTRRLIETYFYFFMSLLIAVVVVYGFSFTVDRNLFHPAVPRPFILWVHAAVFSGWVLFFILQSGLVRRRKVRWHQRMGYFGAAMGGSMVVLGVATAIVMAKFNTVRLHQTGAAAFLIIPLFDMLCFATTLGLAVYWRKKPEYHRRLMLVVTCTLTEAAFGRLGAFGHIRPFKMVGFGPIMPFDFNFAGVDLLILLGVARDLIVNRRVHPVYLYVLPAFVVGQTIVAYTYAHRLPYWMSVAHLILR